MEEDIKILESYIEKINEGYCKDCNELCNMYGVPAEPPIRIAEAIQNLIARYKELEEENIHWKGQYHLLSRKIDVIPKSEVKEKIKEKMKYLFVDSSGIDEGKYEAFMYVLSLLED